VIIVADVDMLHDVCWARIQQLFGQKILIKQSDNCDFLLNTLDNLSGSNDLISLRSRGKYQRPFDKVAEIRKDAEVRFQQREKELEEKLRDTEQKITQLQQGQEGEGSVVLTPEAIEEIRKFREEQVKTRQDLRKVKHDLLQDVESLGTKVTLVNVFLVPFLVLAFGLTFLLVRRKNG
jgi:ABC-type uncharacterized transport system involved in gliding motility auxiliary subunit